ncbi:glycoside hydrolase [Streptomyces sp. CS227]|uniref:C40 family peptidase n=1 Tax=Streptomyces sp. CS227 TaxID=1982763 RepID=UPI000B40BECD|nr:C40 family peptidase [Streptomyces sp. CS227]OWA06465.1 glycoside hydrolase [Streptomyces sp. CS227]
MALRAGVAGGVLSTIAVAGSANAATAAEPVTETIEMPTLTAALTSKVALSAEATQQAADAYQYRAEQQSAAEKAVKDAKKAHKAAEKKAEAAAEKKAEERAAAERAARSAERTDLSGVQTAAATSSSSGSSASAPSQDVPAPASGSVASVVSFLQAQVGDAYVMGGTGPNSWDCSGLVQAAFKQVGVDLPRTSQEQSTAGTQVGTSNLQVGDILYWGGQGSAYHTGVYIGDGKYLDAANPSKGVVIQDLSGYPADGAVRVL